MSEEIRAPFTTEQVEALNRYQNAGAMHPFTCPSEKHQRAQILIATPDFWMCPIEDCNYRQYWAHKFMTRPEACEPWSFKENQE